MATTITITGPMAHMLWEKAGQPAGKVSDAKGNVVFPRPAETLQVPVFDGAEPLYDQWTLPCGVLSVPLPRKMNDIYTLASNLDASELAMELLALASQ